jgi:hypothetical protein
MAAIRKLEENGPGQSQMAIKEGFGESLKGRMTVWALQGAECLHLLEEMDC